MSLYVRENKSWIVGRILRDNEVYHNKSNRLEGAAIRISIFKALPAPKRRILWCSLSEFVWLVATLTQIAIAAIPWGLNGEWGVFLITMSGIIAAVVAGKLPQWDLEKLPLKRKSSKYIALTSGNGSREVMIIYGDGEALDLEELAAGESPRSNRMWESPTIFSKAVKDKDGKPLTYKNNHEIRRAYMFRGLPVGLWVTRIACLFQVVFWIALLITVAGLKSHSWYLVLVGGLGMMQNATIAAVARAPDRRGLPLAPVDEIIANSIMDGIMDLEGTINGSGEALLDEFFPGPLHKKEQAWWNGERDAYDDERESSESRTRPRSRMPRKNIGVPDIDRGDKINSNRRIASWKSSVHPEPTKAGVSLNSLPRSNEIDSRINEKIARVSSKEASLAGSAASQRCSPMRSQDSVRSPDWA